MARPTDEQVREQLAKAEENDGKWRGMTHEQGVANALRWVLGDDELAPMEEEE